MTTRRLVCRALLAAAVSTATVVQTNGSVAFGFETAAKAGTGIQQAQFQHGQPASPPGGTVSQELNRMFQESGQPMPSMRPQDLPNAQGQQSGMVRQKPQPGQTGQKVQQKAQPAKKNFLQKFMGKISGQDKKQAEAAVVPPVPPGYREPMPAPPASVDIPQKTAQNPKGRGISGNGQMSPSNGPARPGNGGLVGAQGRPNSGSNSGGQTRQVSQPTQPVPGVPAGRGVARNLPVHSATQSVSKSATPGTLQTPKYTQPGTAPSFMPPQPSTRPSTSTLVTPSVSAPPVQRPEPKAAPPVDDGFVDPFADSDVADMASDSLDLDSLDLDAIAEKPVVEDALAGPTAEPEQTTATATISSAPASASALAIEGGSAADASTRTAATNEQPVVTPESNPFTGVTLHESDEAGFGKEPASTTIETSSTEATTTVVEGEFGGPAHPVEDFGSNLPAIDLPPVDEIEVQPSEITANAAALDIPDLDAEDTAEATMTGTLEQTPMSPDGASALSSSGSDDPQPAEGSGSAATPLKSLDAEKLQQAAEQDRRLRQQRLIQSRTGQSGFKGFCPVALRDRRELVDASPEFSATFGLQTYTFATLEAKAAFEAEPSRYAPAIGGSDVVLLVNSGEEQVGLLDYALWHRDRLYLFRSRETMRQFAQDPQRFASQY